MAKKTVETKATVKTVKPTTTTADMRMLSTKELTEMLAGVKADLAEAQRTHAAGELVNPRVLNGFKKTIARIKTLMGEKMHESNGKEDK